MQYVRKMENPLYVRVTGHRFDYYHRLHYKPVAKHFFNTPGHAFEDAIVMIIKQLHLANSTRRKYRESYWITPFECLTHDSLKALLHLSCVNVLSPLHTDPYTLLYYEHAWMCFDCFYISKVQMRKHKDL